MIHAGVQLPPRGVQLWVFQLCHEHTAAGTAWRQRHSPEEILLCPGADKPMGSSQTPAQVHRVGAGEWEWKLGPSWPNFRESGSNSGAYCSVKCGIVLYDVGIGTGHVDRADLASWTVAVQRLELGVSSSVGCTKPWFCLCCNFREYFLFPSMELDNFYII